MLIDAFALVFLLVTVWLAAIETSLLPTALLQPGAIALGFSGVWVICTLLAEWMRRALYPLDGRTNPRAAAVASGAWLIFLTLLVGLPMLLGWEKMTALEAAAMALVLPASALGLLVALAAIGAARRRTHARGMGGLGY